MRPLLDGEVSGGKSCIVVQIRVRGVKYVNHILDGTPAQLTLSLDAVFGCPRKLVPRANTFCDRLRSRVQRQVHDARRLEVILQSDGERSSGRWTGAVHGFVECKIEVNIGLRDMRQLHDVTNLVNYRWFV